MDQYTVAVKNDPGITMGTFAWNLISLKIIDLVHKQPLGTHGAKLQYITDKREHEF